MTRRRLAALGCGVAIAIVISPWAVCRVARLRAGAPAPIERELAPGVRYEREVSRAPRPVVLHWARIDLREGHALLVTPAEPGGGARARTATERLADLGADLVVNANYFHYPQRGWLPWHEFPASGEVLGCMGTAISAGRVLCDDRWEEGATLYVPREGAPRLVDRPAGELRLAVSGRYVLVRDGEVAVATGVDDRPYPRAALGLDPRGEIMTWVVVDGQVPGAREGLGLRELAERLIARGAWSAIELDGGGSAELAAREGDRIERLSTPSHRELPGLSRAVPIHLALRYAR